jgi:hypothetical protein
LTVANALIFMKKTKMEPDELNVLITEIFRDKTNNTKGIISINKSEKKVIIQNLVWKYLDWVCFNREDNEKITALKDTFAMMRKNDIDMEALFEAWNSLQIRNYEPGITFKTIRDFMKGS